MININLKGQNGIYNELKLVDAYKVDENLSLVFLYNNENENGLFKLYVGKYINGVLDSVNDAEWAIAKNTMVDLVNGKNIYSVIELPKFIDCIGQLKPCLIASTDFFENHYKVIQDKNDDYTFNSAIDESKFKFTGDGQWKNSIVNDDNLDEKPVNSVDSIINEANNIKINNIDEDKLIESIDYKGQKENFVNLVSRALDEIMETKNKELVDMSNQIEQLETELRKSELEKKQVINIINMYHEKIKKLSDAIRESNGESNE